MDEVPEAAHVPSQPVAVDRRVVLVMGMAVDLGLAAALVAELLMAFIGLFTNLAFFNRLR